MKHAGASALDSLEPLLLRLRQIDGLKEIKRGIFYRRGRSFLHFHEDPAGLFADVALGPEDLRLQVDTPEQQAVLVARIEALLGPGA